MSDKIISIDTLKHYNDKISNYVDEKVSNINSELEELNAILVDTDEVANDPVEIGGPSVITQTSNIIEALQPNVITIITDPLLGVYIYDFVNSSSKHDEYTIIFSTLMTESESPHITLPDYVLWANGSIPTLEGNTIYELSITRDFIKVILEGTSDAVEQNIYKAVLTPFKSVE